MIGLECNAGIRQAARGNAPTGTAGRRGLDGIMAVQSEHKELDELKVQLSDLSSMIATTIKEIGSVRHPGMDQDRLHGAVDELAAIVLDTEAATDQILDAAEAVDALAGDARDAAGLPLQPAFTDLTTRIFEACNFQDLSGQRIAKVTTLLRDIDTRLCAIIDAIGESRFSAVAPPSARTGDEALLNGPALTGALQQDSIDALMG